jgi:hypothetical protein
MQNVTRRLTGQDVRIDGEVRVNDDRSAGMAVTNRRMAAAGPPDRVAVTGLSPRPTSRGRALS